MKTTLLALLISVQSTGFAATDSQAMKKAYSFQFKSLKGAITTTASSKEEAFKIAAKECFSKLTGGRYPGEEKGLEIIDICANPKM